MKRNIPTRIVEVGRLVRGASGQGVGWLQNQVDRIRNFRAKLQGIQDRLNTPFSDGVPGSVFGELTFTADIKRTITIPNFPVDPDSTAADFIALTVNPIILSGQTYRIPIIFSPPGVLMAHNLVVGIEAGYTMFANYNRPGIFPLNDYRQIKPITGTPPAFLENDAANFAIQYTWEQQVLGNFTSVMPFLPFLWNIIDEKSGRQYARDWMPHGALLNTRGNSAGLVPGALYSDSELFEFDTPWPFERDAQVSFLFRPIMDLYQVAASDTQFPWVDGDGENIEDRNGGARNQQATVRVEFHGNRYYGVQDVLKEGAFVTNAPEPSRQPYTPNP